MNVVLKFTKSVYSLIFVIGFDYIFYDSEIGLNVRFFIAAKKKKKFSSTCTLLNCAVTGQFLRLSRRLYLFSF